MTDPRARISEVQVEMEAGVRAAINEGFLELAHMNKALGLEPADVGLDVAMVLVRTMIQGVLPLLMESDTPEALRTYEATLMFKAACRAFQDMADANAAEARH